MVRNTQLRQLVKKERSNIMAKQMQKEFSTPQLKAMLNKNSGATASEVKYAIRELKKRGEPTPPPSTVTGGRGEMAGPLPRPANNKSKGGMPVPEDNKGLSKLPKGVRNKMGYMSKGGMPKKYNKGGYANCGASVAGTQKK